MGKFPGVLDALKFTILQNIVNAVLYVQRSRWLSLTSQPDALKTYPCRPNLFANRIFKPKDASSGSKRLPLIIQVHGGGYVINNPSRDDPLARLLADTCNCIVVSIDYRKAPQNKFPLAYEDVVGLSLAIINDTELPIDKERVVLSGNSAGGNLVLAAAQDVRLRSNVLGVTALYPVCDAVPTLKDKIATRPDPTIPDILASSYDTLLKMYIGLPDVNLEDPRLSPGRFASRDDLPQHVYLIGAEHDLLSAEAQAMAEKLAEGSPKQETTHGWRAGSVRWDNVPGQIHGFDQFGAGNGSEERRVAQKDETYQAMADWLVEVFKTSGSNVSK